MPTPFSLTPITKPTQALACLQSIYCSLYKSGVMLDKVTKACYNFFVFALFCFMLLVPLVLNIRAFTKATLKRVAVQSIF